jgi:O-antigen ligase
VSRAELRRYLIPAAVVGAAGVVLVFAVVPGFSNRAENRLDSQLPLWDRLNSNAAAARMAQDKPLLGFGWNTFEYYPEYFRQGRDRPLTIVPRPHNVFLANAAELGVIATAAWIACIAVALIGGLVQRGPPELDDWRTGLIAVGVGWIVVANLTPMNYAFCHSVFWLWMGLGWSRT